MIRARPPLRTPRDRGLITTELVIVLPILVSFLYLLVLAGRLTDARSDVVGAANDAARAASLQTNLAAAQIQAQAAAEDTVRGERLHCIGNDGAPTVNVEAIAPPNPPPGQPGGFARGADVRVTVTCQVNTSDLNFIGVGATVTLTEVAWEPIDPYRSL
jgi:Flp pilus assembly protein TadG